jgi:hypothetical protein
MASTSTQRTNGQKNAPNRVRHCVLPLPHTDLSPDYNSLWPSGLPRRSTQRLSPQSTRTCLYTACVHYTLHTAPLHLRPATCACACACLLRHARCANRAANGRQPTASRQSMLAACCLLLASCLIPQSSGSPGAREPRAQRALLCKGALPFYNCNPVSFGNKKQGGCCAFLAAGTWLLPIRGSAEDRGQAPHHL